MGKRVQALFFTPCWKVWQKHFMVSHEYETNIKKLQAGLIIAIFSPVLKLVFVKKTFISVGTTWSSACFQSSVHKRVKSEIQNFFLICNSTPLNSTPHSLAEV